MSETTTGTAQTETTPTPKDVAETTPGKATETPEQTIEALRTALAKANAEAKENRIKAKELDEVKKSQMSELEQAQASAREAQERLIALEQNSLRQKVALEKGVPAKWVDRLRGATEAELAADADVILADLAPANGAPKPDLSQGGSGGAIPLNSDGLEEALKSKLGIT